MGLRPQSRLAVMVCLKVVFVSRLMRIEICYTLRYMVNKASKHIPNWTERQLGIYHRFGSSTKAVMMLLQTGLGTDLESRLNDILKNEQSARDSLADPLLLHLKVLSTYLDNWRSYLQTPARYCRAKV